MNTELRQRETQWEARDGLFVFHRNGRRIGDYRKSWKAACRRVGLVGRIFHDLRCTAAHDMRRAGASEGEIMRLWQADPLDVPPL
jgi:integrase